MPIVTPAPCNAVAAQTQAHRDRLVERIGEAGLVAIIRADSPAGLVDACKALHDGGVTVCEITMTTPNALDAIALARKTFGDAMLVGVGSVTDEETVERAVGAGAQFVVSPVTVERVILACHMQGVPTMPGAMTPTEIWQATRMGADVVKVFPANHFGPTYFKDVLAPLPQLKLMPTGGVTRDNVGQWFAAGAVALGVGSSLVKKDLLKAGDWKGLAAEAKAFTDAVKAARQR
jgi:2-dehydro-3-deoxyphosphogluconate aldolase/(4S)-4-hydroxy-2-oxoglutarate aldolase